MRTMIERFKSVLQTGVGSAEKRPVFLLWNKWTEEAQQEKLDQGLVEANSTSTTSIYPLDTFQPDDEDSFQACFHLWRKFNPAIDYYLKNHVFPRVMQCQEEKISASGQALGSSLLFQSRLAFSGTPSDLLPQEENKSAQLYPCKFEKGSEAKILHTLSDPSRVNVREVEDQWSVEKILQQIAQSGEAGSALGGRRIDVLIDTGALITGKSNEEVAQYLLDHGIPWAKGVVFLNPHDEKCVLLRSGANHDDPSSRDKTEKGRVMMLSQCGIAWEDRFSFYDQIHTTGMDIKQHDHAKAAITIGKDTTFRDFAQGAYRMRSFAKGLPQTLEILLVPEVAGLVRKEVGAQNLGGGGGVGSSDDMRVMDSKALTAVAAWLLLNQIRLESQQMLQLCIQNIDGVTRRAALSSLLQLKRSNEGISTLSLTDAFTEMVDVRIPDQVPVAQSFVQSLEERVQENTSVVPLTSAGAATIRDMMRIAQQQTTSQRKTKTKKKNRFFKLDDDSDNDSDNDSDDDNGSAQWAHKDLDAAQTRTQEKEQQLEQEKQKQREIEREASPWKATERDNEIPVVWNLQDLINKNQPNAFYNMGKFKLRSKPGEDAVGSNVCMSNLLTSVVKRAPNVFLSENFAASKFTSPRGRRLRSLYTVLQWESSGKGGQLGKTAALTLLEAATVKRAGGEMQEYPTHLRLCVMPQCQILMGADIPDHTVRSAVEIVEEKARRAQRRGGGGGGAKVDLHNLEVRAVAALLEGQSHPGVQMLRYFDCQTNFTEVEGSSLLSTLASVAPLARQQFFSTTVMSKRRDQTKWVGTTLTPYMLLKSYDDLMHVRQLKGSILIIMERRGMNSQDLARMIDQNRDMSLSIDEIILFLSSKEMQREQGMPGPKQLAGLKGPLLLIADQKMDGRVSYDELEEFLLAQ